MKLLEYNIILKLQIKRKCDIVYISEIDTYMQEKRELHEILTKITEDYMLCA